jgi:hypothetical protein
LKQSLRCPVVLDGRNLFKGAEMAEAGLDYHSMGRVPRQGSLLKKAPKSKPLPHGGSQ